MAKTKIGVFLILTILMFGFVMFKEVKGNVPTKSLAVMTYNVGTLNGERIRLDKIGEVIRSRRAPRLNPLRGASDEAIQLGREVGGRKSEDPSEIGTAFHGASRDQKDRGNEEVAGCERIGRDRGWGTDHLRNWRFGNWDAVWLSGFALKWVLPLDPRKDFLYICGKGAVL